VENQRPLQYNLPFLILKRISFVEMLFIQRFLNISGSNILGNKAYGTEKIRAYITEQNAKYTIPPKENNSDPWYCDYWLYKERHLYYYICVVFLMNISS